jgi:hypothetical protein
MRNVFGFSKQEISAMATKRAAKRELIDTGSDKRYVRRNE